MPLPVFPFRPTAQGYNPQALATSAQSQVGGGLPRTQTIFRNGAYLLNVTWRLRQAEGDQLQVFWIDELQSGGLPCQMELVTRYGHIEDHEVHFVPGSFRGPQISGQRRTFSAQIYAKAIAARDSDYETSVALMMGEYGTGLDEFARTMERIMQNYLVEDA